MVRSLSPSDHEIAATLQPYGFVPASQFCDKVREYLRLLQHWNRLVSLTTVISTAEILKFHFGESLFAFPAVRLERGRLADVGSGAGFPGVPIAMAAPSTEALLIEANAKKAAFLAEVKRVLELDNVRIYHGRAESIPSTDKFAFVTARAVGDESKLLKWSADRMFAGGRVVLWLGAKQMEEARQIGGWRWCQPSLIPQTRARFILTGSPVREDMA